MTMQRSAVIDGCYRYWLTRGPGVDACGFVMLNPSDADALVNDNTVGRLEGFARDWGYRTLHVANLYAYRTPYPAALWAHQGDIVGPDNDGYLHAIATLPLVVVAWGANPRPGRVAEVLEILRAPGRPLFCLGTTANGSPKHPLYVPYSQKLLEFT